MENNYLEEMYQACISNHENLFRKNCLYYGKEGHLRLAREMGYALNDFPVEQHSDIIQSSYPIFYVRVCNLKPLLCAKVWMDEMRKSIKK